METINQLDLSEALDLPEEGWVIECRRDGKFIGFYRTNSFGHLGIAFCLFGPFEFTKDGVACTTVAMTFDDARRIARECRDTVGIEIWANSNPRKAVGFHWVK